VIGTVLLILVVVGVVVGATSFAISSHARTRRVEELTAALDAERAQTAEAERTRRTQEAILAGLRDGVALFGGDGSVRYANPECAAILGAPLPDAFHLTPPSLRDLVTASRADGPTATEFSIVAPARVIRATATPLPAADGGVLLVLRDVTEARRTDAVRRDFVANASHELKTPAASVQALAETIATAADDDPGAVRRFAEQLEEEAARLSRIISDLLDLSRLEGEPGPREVVPLDRVVEQEAERLRPQAEAAGLRLDVEATTPAAVAGSSRDLGLLVRNLVQNAIQYTRPGGAVAVELASSDGQVVLVVRDTGIGIPARERERVFERFYRVDRGRSRETGGTGLGLSLVRHVTENHGGSVELETALGEGSTFRVRLPLEEPPILPR
jgi:two-component system sensor histidine kinase SenX3